MPEAKSEQLQQAPALLLATPLQGRDSYMLGEPTVRLLDSMLFQGIWSTEVPQDCCPTPQCLVSWTSWLLKPSLQKGLPLRTGEATILLLQVLGPGLLFLVYLYCLWDLLLQCRLGAPPLEASLGWPFSPVLRASWCWMSGGITPHMSPEARVVRCPRGSSLPRTGVLPWFSAKFLQRALSINHWHKNS